MQGADRHLPGLEHDFHHVEAVIDPGAIQHPQVTVRRAPQRLFLLRADRLARPAKVGIGPRAHLDEGEDFSVTADEIDLAAGNQEIAVEDAVPVAAQERRRNALTIRARFLRRRQRRRRRIRGSVENLADELQKGREG